MAEESPQNINPSTDPQVEDPPSAAVPLSEIDRAPADVSAANNPQIPQTASANLELITANQPDLAFVRAQQSIEERWQTATAANPGGVNPNGSVSVDLGGGQRETINRDGSFEIAGAGGTYRYNADGQLQSYTSPTINGFSQTVTTDGIEVLNFRDGPITSTAIIKDGQPISTTAQFDAGVTRGTVVNTVGGQPVVSQQTQVPDGSVITRSAVIDTQEDLQAFNEQTSRDVQAALGLDSQTVEQDPQVSESPVQTVPVSEIDRSPAVVTGDPEIELTQTQQEAAGFVPVSAIDTGPGAVIEDEAIISFEEAQAQDQLVPVSAIDTGPAPLTPEEIAEYENRTSGLRIVESEVGAKAEAPFVSEESRRAAGEFYAANPETIREIINSPPPIETTVTTEEVLLSEIEVAPAEVDPADDLALAEIQAQQEAAEFVPASEIDLAAADVDPADDPGVPQPVDDLPDALVYQAADDVLLEEDPILLAQADATATDVALVDLTAEPELVDQDADPNVSDSAAPPEGGFYGEPTAVGGNFTSVYDPETGTYSVVDLDTGETVETGLSQQQATLAAEEFSLGDPQFPNDTDALAAQAESDIIREPTDVDVAEAQFVETDTGFFELQEEAAPQPDEFGFVEADDGFFVTQDEIEATIDQEQFEGETDPEEFVPLSEINEDAEPVLASDAAEYGADAEGEGEIVEFTADGPVTRDANEATAEAARIEAQRVNLRNQQSIREQRGNNVDSADWRVRLRLAPAARYLYLDNEYGPGILEPLQVSDGVIFPYTPTIQTIYKADYQPYNLTHSNYKGFFYQSSYVEDVTITGVFTAQDSNEAAYLLAVIHFFRSATKMFYGQDPQRGAPPPLVFLSAFGQYQYVDAPCVISQFNYSLPADVDYIRARAPNQDGTNLLKRRIRQTLPTNAFSAALQRLKNARTGGLPVGGEPRPPAPPTLGLGSPTYVPTKMEITIMLHPMQSRAQVSQQFSVKEYAPGRLTPKGFW